MRESMRESMRERMRERMKKRMRESMREGVRERERERERECVREREREREKQEDDSIHSFVTFSFKSADTRFLDNRGACVGKLVTISMSLDTESWGDRDNVRTYENKNMRN